MLILKLHQSMLQQYIDELDKNDVDYTLNGNEITIPAGDSYTWNLAKIYYTALENKKYGVRETEEKNI